MHYHRRHDRGERKRAKTSPHHPAIAAVSIHFGQDIAEDVRNREEQHAREKSNRAEQWHLDRGFLRRADQIRAKQDRDKSCHHEIVITEFTGGMRRWFHARKDTQDMSRRLCAKPACRRLAKTITPKGVSVREICTLP